MPPTFEFVPEASRVPNYPVSPDPVFLNTSNLECLHSYILTKFEGYLQKANGFK